MTDELATPTIEPPPDLRVDPLVEVLAELVRIIIDFEESNSNAA